MRLTKEMKASIVTKAMKDFMADEKAKIEERRVAFGIEVYEHTYGAVEAVVMTLSEEWRDMSHAVDISCEGFESKSQFHRNDPDRLEASITLGHNRPFPYKLRHSSGIEINAAKESKGFKTAEHPLYRKAQKLVKDHQAIVTKEDELREKIRALLNSVNTDKQLADAWPEGMQFLPQVPSYSTALVPVGLSDMINKALGIPSKASTATTAVRKAATH